MKVTVHTVDRAVEFDATAVRTDEHNNLEVLSGRLNDKPLGLFNKDSWESALYGEEVTDDSSD